ncbi:hypothetical protein HYPGJ_30104 [Hyphomicrobium sp. GJ21]|nr:hypothetical protein HYPGJ_30104 [Hyphomicrobium sp. GJ21]
MMNCAPNSSVFSTLRRRKSLGPSRSREPSSHASFRPRQQKARPHSWLTTVVGLSSPQTLTQRKPWDRVLQLNL